MANRFAELFTPSQASWPVHSYRRAIGQSCRAAALAGALLGCPQFLDGDFDTGVPGSAGSGALGSTGSLDSSTPDSGVSSEGDAGCPGCVCAFGEFSSPALVSGLGITGDLWGPSIAADGRRLSFSHHDGVSEKLYIAARVSQTVFASASASAEMALLNGPDNQGTPFLSLDGLSIYFYASPAAGDRDLYSATRVNRASAFDHRQPVPGVNSSASDQLPWVSLDERTIYFTSRRPGSRGGANIWRATRAARLATFGTPLLVEELCSDQADEKPALTLDQRHVIFMSDRPGSLGDDLWTASRKDVDSPFDEPVRIASLDTSGDEREPALSSDGRELFFTSTLEGARAVYRATREYHCEGAPPSQ